MNFYIFITFNFIQKDRNWRKKHDIDYYVGEYKIIQNVDEKKICKPVILHNGWLRYNNFFSITGSQIDSYIQIYTCMQR